MPLSRTRREAGIAYCRTDGTRDRHTKPGGIPNLEGTRGRGKLSKRYPRSRRYMRKGLRP